MKKDKIKEKILKDGKEQYLSAQEFAKLSSDDKRLLKEVLTDEGIDADDYERRMEKLWPKTFQPKPLVWRNR